MLFRSIVVKCAYGFNYNGWKKFRFTLVILSGVQIALHIGIPGTYYLLKIITPVSKEYERAVYDSRVVFLGTLLFLDGLFYILSVLPYWCLYSVTSDKVDNVETIGRMRKSVYDD